MEQRVAEKVEEMPATPWKDESALIMDTQEEDVTGAVLYDAENEGTDAEELQLRQRARWLLKNFKNLLDRKHKQEEEMGNVPLFTRDDALYKCPAWRRTRRVSAFRRATLLMRRSQPR
jgi:hypothetical protein